MSSTNLCEQQTVAHAHLPVAGTHLQCATLRQVVLDICGGESGAQLGSDVMEVTEDAICAIRLQNMLY